MRILFVEDSVRLRQSVGAGLKKAGHAVDSTGDGPEGLWYAESNEYDVIILDWMLPGMDGMEILGKLRDNGKQTPILFLTAKDTVDDRVEGLQSGADDYLVKPFAFEELLARVQTLARRGYGVRTARIAVADLVIDTASKTAARKGKPVDLTPREYKLLEYLAHRQGEVVTRTEIEERIYDEHAEPMSNVVDSTVCGLRRKIDRPGAASLLHTRRGLGYVLGEAKS
ncbi:response regulator transcription factor [bacterium]|nr:response regulator transcription factor [bacterium]